MSDLLEPLLDSWDRGNTILVNLLRMLPPGALGERTTDGGHTIGELFTHIHSVRLVLVAENAPEHAVPVPEDEWVDERDVERLAAMLDASAGVVRNAVQGRVENRRAMDQLYDHPILMIQHLIWHEAYHHGQVKLALKQAGRPIPDRDVGKGTWGVWMRKTRPRSE